MSRTTLRGDDLLTTKGIQRPVNEALRDISIRLDSQPRRQQTWVRFTVSEADGISTIIGETIRGPGYSIAAVIVLAVQPVALPPDVALTGPPWLSIEPVEGYPSTARITDAYGVPQSGTFDCLVEFVENTTAVWPRTDVTGGSP